jgi:cell migration-inducing and hyaluronan-binding protein
LLAPASSPARQRIRCRSGSECGSPAASRWSDPATWPDKKVPAKDDVVTIEKDMNVILDVSPPPLHGIKLERHAQLRG